MSSKKSKEVEKNDEEESQSAPPSPPQAMEELVVQPSTGSLLNMSLQLSQDNFLLHRLSFPINNYMEGFLRCFLRLPGAHLLSHPVVVNAATLLMQCVRFCGERVELVQMMVRRRARLERGESLPPFVWSLMPMAYRRRVDEMHPSRVDNSQTLLPYSDSQSLMVIEDDTDEEDSDVNMEVEDILNPIDPNASPQKLQERAAQLQKRLDEPCSSEMASRLQKELNEVLMRLPYTPEGTVYNLDKEYTVSEVGSNFSSASSEKDTASSSTNLENEKNGENMDTQEEVVRPKRKLKDLDEYLDSSQPKKKLQYWFGDEEDGVNTAQNKVDDFPKADQSNGQDNDENQSEESDEMDITFTNDSGIIITDISTDNDVSMNLENMVAGEQNNLACCEGIILNECQNNAGDATMANVMENEPSSSGVSQFFMAALTLATEHKVKLEDKGEQGKPTTVEQLGVKLSRNP